MGRSVRFNTDRWFRHNVDQRTRQELKSQEQRFLAEHANDTDEQLAAVIKARARELKRSPQMVEVTGAWYMVERFGSWNKALAAADQHMPSGSPKLTRSDRYKAEYARQAALFKAERARIREEREARKAAWLAQKEQNAQEPRDPDAH